MAHNAPVHRGMVKEAFGIMRRVAIVSTDHPKLPPPPPGVTSAEWFKFHQDIVSSVKALGELTGKPDPGFTGDDASGPIGDAAASPDDNIDDTHLFVKIGSVGGLGAAAKIGDTALKDGLAIALVPFVCTCECVASFFGFGGDDVCDECVKHAKDFADKVPTPSDLTNLIPGVGDITSGQFTGLWHFVNMAPALPNQYDDHEGMLYEVAGPFRQPGGVDLAIMAGTDLVGLSVNPKKSQGVQHYQIASPGDSFPDGDTYAGSKIRSNAEWQKYPMGHVPFSPVDNLALYGWDRFRHQGGAVADLGYPLHALGDATVPMHAAGTTSWGHRPFEDAQSELYQAGKLQFDSDSVLAKAMIYRKAILQWRAAGHPGDIPIRWLVRTVARNTYKDAAAKEIATLALTPASPWPYNDAASVAYLVTTPSNGAQEAVTGIYRDRPDDPTLYQPMFEDGLAAILAFLTSVPETTKIAQADAPSPGRAGAALAGDAPAHLIDAAYDGAAPEAPRLGVGPTRGRQPVEADPAETAFLDALRTDYAALARLFIAGKLTPPQYLQRVRDRSRKAAMAERDPTYYRAYARGDADGDLVPDDRDNSPGTPRLTPTDNRGAMVADVPETYGRGQSRGPSQREMANIFAHTNLMIAPECAAQGGPDKPRLLELGYGFNNRDLIFEVAPAGPTSAKCPVFYEVTVHFTKVFPGNANFLPGETWHEAVFRSDQNSDKTPDPNRYVFRIPRSQPQTGESDFLLQNVARYSGIEWRARAINANGMTSDWSDWKAAPFKTLPE